MPKTIAILGAGAIGCAVGTIWAGVGASVTLIGRKATVNPLRDAPVVLTGRAFTVGPTTVATDPAALAQADVVVVAMKAHSLEAAMEQIVAHARPDAPVISLLNGIDPARRLRDRFPDRDVIAGMVPYNVVWTGPSAMNVTGPGEVALERHSVTEALAEMGAPIELHNNLGPIQHGKLLLNLANAVNALSGKPLHAMLSDRTYRKVYAASIKEALTVYKAAGIVWEQVGPTNPKVAIPMLRAPNWLFNQVVLKRQNLDPTSMTSMASDLAAGRPTEVDVINGEIIRIGHSNGVATPVNAALSELVNAVESGARTEPVTAQELLRAVIV